MYSLLIKSTSFHAGKYMLFGNPPRWHMITGKTKVPRTAPVAADPNAAGSGKAVHLPDEKVNQLKYDAEKAKTNRDMAAFNDKHLPELISHAKRGDVAAILGTSYGVNTHGKRKASIANYLLSEMGSEHRVTPGQKAGTHAGVSGPSKSEVVQMALDHILEDQKQANIPESEKAQDRKLATKIKAEPNKDKAIQLALDHLTEDEKQPDMPKAENADDAKMISTLEQAKTDLSIPDFVEGKATTGVVDYYRNIAQKVVSMAAAGDSEGVKAMVDKGLKPNAKGVISNTWAGKTENSKRLLALVDQAVGAGASKAGNQQAESTDKEVTKQKTAVTLSKSPKSNAGHIALPFNLGSKPNVLKETENAILFAGGKYNARTAEGDAVNNNSGVWIPKSRLSVGKVSFDGGETVHDSYFLEKAFYRQKQKNLEMLDANPMTFTYPDNVKIVGKPRSLGDQQVDSTLGTTQNVVSKAKDLGVQGLRQNMTEKSLRTKLESHLLAKKSEMYLKAGKDSGLPQYSDVDEKAIPVLASIISTNKFSIDTSGSVWSFDGRGIKERGELVKGGILFGVRGGYRHDFTKAGREIAHKMLLENFENKSNDDLLREIGDLNNTDKKQNLPTSQKQSSKSEVTTSPKEGERNAEGLIFRDGRWHRDDQKEQAQSKPAASTAKPQHLTRKNARLVYKDANGDEQEAKGYWHFNGNRVVGGAGAYGVIPAGGKAIVASEHSTLKDAEEAILANDPKAMAAATQTPATSPAAKPAATTQAADEALRKFNDRLVRGAKNAELNTLLDDLKKKDTTGKHKDAIGKIQVMMDRENLNSAAYAAQAKLSDGIVSGDWDDAAEAEIQNSIKKLPGLDGEMEAEKIQRILNRDRADYLQNRYQKIRTKEQSYKDVPDLVMNSGSLPELSGNADEKFKAGKIRADKLDRHYALLDAIRAKAKDVPSFYKILQSLKAVPAEIKALFGNTDSQFWIRNADKKNSELIAEMKSGTYATDDANSTESPKEGDRNEKGLVFHNGRWHRDDKPPETKKDEYSDDPNSPNYRFKDTGEISGSRKEMAANSIRQAGKTGRMLRSTDIDWEEIESNPREASEIIKKSNLFGLVDWQGLKAEGMSPAAGFLADRVYASISPTPAVDGAQGRKDYAKGIETIRDRIERCKTVDEVTNVLSQIKEELSGTMLSASDADAYKVAYDRYKALNEKYQAAKKQVDAYAQKWNKATAAKRVADYEVEKRVRRGWKPSAEANKNAANAEIEAESSYQEYMQARNDIPVKEMEQASMSAFKEAKAIEKASISKNIASNPATRAWIALGNRFFGVVNWRSYKGSDVFSGHVTNAKQGNIKDWSWSEKEHATVKKASKKAIAFQIKVAENFDRKGGRTISANSTSALKSAFNLRDVQSGNWVLKDPKSAEFHVQRAAEAFSDLADIVGAENEHVSMNGRLAVAFGARGVGNAGFGGSARASYEPIHRVINLTKMGGGGCLAHEWFHALDNLIIEAEGGESNKASYATETPELLPASDLKEAFVDLRNAMTSGDERGFVSIQYQKEDVQLAERNVNNRTPNGVAEIIASENNATDALIAVNDYFNKKYNGGKISRKTKNNIDSWRRIAVAYHDKGQSQDGVLTLKAGAKRSSFHHEASILDGNSTGKYWSSMREMAARAFQAYVEDKMSESGRKNDYLSVFADNKYYNDPIFGQQRPFPEGDERKRINESFDRLMSVILARKTLTKAAGLFCIRGAKSFLLARRVA